MNSLETISVKEESKASRKTQLLILSFLVLVVSANWALSLDVRLLSDDFTGLYLISTNSWDCFYHACTGRLLEMPSFGEHYRPLTCLIYCIDYLVFGINSAGLHFSNLLWHYAATALSFLLSLKICSSFETENKIEVSFWTAMIFAIHPFHGEPISWWIGKVDIVYSCWYMLALWLHLESISKSSRAYKIGALITFLLALSSKESALTFPAVIFLFSIMTSSKVEPKARIVQALKAAIPYMLVLFAFAAVRAVALGVCFGGYYGMVNTNNLRYSISQYTNLQCISAALFPFDGGNKSMAGSAAYALLTGIYLFAIYSMSRALEDGSGKRFMQASIFSFLFLVTVMAPAFYVWAPSVDFTNNRVLYLAIFPASLLLTLFLFSFKSNKRLAHICMICCCIILAISSQSAQLRWIEASHQFDKFKALVEQKSNAQKTPQRLMIFNIPTKIDGVPLYIHFPKLQELLLPPFSKNAKWQNMEAFEPQYFGDDMICNLTRLRKVISAPERYNFLTVNNNFEFKDMHMDKVTAPSDALPISASSTDVGVREQRRFNYFRLPREIKQNEYQFMHLKYRTNSSKIKKELPLALMWKKSGDSNFDENKSCFFAPKTSRQSNEVTVHLGEQVEWLGADDISEIEIVSDENIYITELTLESDSKLLPVFQATPAANILGPDQVLRAKADTYYFDYDVSNIVGAKSVKVEVSKAFYGFRYYTYTYRDTEPCKEALKSFTVDGAKGSFKLDKHLGSPIWHEIRIFAQDSNGNVIAYSSDPLYILSATHRSDDGDLVKIAPGDEH